MKIVRFWVKGEIIKVSTPWHISEKRFPSEWEEKLYSFLTPLTRRYGTKFCFLIRDVLDYQKIEKNIKKFPAIEIDNKIVHEGEITLQELIEILDGIKE